MHPVSTPDPCDAPAWSLHAAADLQDHLLSATSGFSRCSTTPVPGSCRPFKPPQAGSIELF